MKILILVFGLAFSLIAKSQATFSKLYDYSDTTVWGYSIIADADNYYIAGSGFTDLVGLSCYVLKTDLNGERIGILQMDGIDQAYLSAESGFLKTLSDTTVYGLEHTYTLIPYFQLMKALMG